jgi:histone acetyltransferase
MKPKKFKFRKNIINLFQKSDLISQWWFLLEKERKKEIFFKITNNNGNKTNTQILLCLKRLFSKQLPNMPKFYISQIIFDIKQKSIALIKIIGQKMQVIGGCSYRIFKKYQQLELIFFAIITSEQMKGYGKILMNFLKDRAKSLEIRTIITCADNNAIKYFLKQGFSQIITSPIFIWAGYICDYEEIKLMECSILKSFKYFNSIPFILNLKLLFLSKLKKVFSKNSLFGLPKNSIFLDIPDKYSYFSLSVLFNIFWKTSKKYINFKSITKINILLNSIKFNSLINNFLEPVNSKKTGAKDYFKTVFYAIDLRTVEERLKEKKYYISKSLLYSDCLTMIQNCFFYNGKNHSISKKCYQIKKLFHYFKSNFF